MFFPEQSVPSGIIEHYQKVNLFSFFLVVNAFLNPPFPLKVLLSETQFLQQQQPHPYPPRKCFYRANHLTNGEVGGSVGWYPNTY